MHKGVDLTGAVLRQCRGCGEMVHWKKSKKGRWTPYNDNGLYHGLTCSKSKKRLEYLENQMKPRA